MTIYSLHSLYIYNDIILEEEIENLQERLWCVVERDYSWSAAESDLTYISNVLFFLLSGYPFMCFVSLIHFQSHVFYNFITPLFKIQKYYH